MSMGSQANDAYRPTCELRKWHKTNGGMGYSGRVFNDEENIMEDGQIHTISEATIKRVHDRGDHWLVVTNGWKFKLMKDQEIIPK